MAFLSSATSNSLFHDDDQDFRAFVGEASDAMLILEAALRGMIPRVTRRFNEREKRSIHSGMVLVFCEEESGIKRWTDGISWSASRILHHFLIYREKESPSPGGRRDSSRLEPQKRVYPGNLVGALNGKDIKQPGLVKKTLSVVVDGFNYHIICYYDPEDVVKQTLRTPAQLPKFRDLEMRESIQEVLRKLKATPETEEVCGVEMTPESLTPPPENTRAWLPETELVNISPPRKRSSHAIAARFEPYSQHGPRFRCYSQGDHHLRHSIPAPRAFSVAAIPLYPQHQNDAQFLPFDWGGLASPHDSARSHLDFLEKTASGALHEFVFSGADGLSLLHPWQLVQPM